MNKYEIEEKMISAFQEKYADEVIMLISSEEDLTAKDNENELQLEITTCDFKKYQVLYKDGNIDIWVSVE